CLDPAAGAAAQRSWNEWRLEVLARVEPGPTRLGQLVHLRRAEVLASLAFERARDDRDGAARAAEEAARELAQAEASLLSEDDRAAQAQAGVRVAASRWAAETAAAVAEKRPHFSVRAGRPGETCVSVIADGKSRLEKCTF